MSNTNPNGANQYVLDPRQKKCWDLYVSPKSKTFGNATQSAIEAGYEASYADVITMTDWFAGKLWRLNSTFVGERKMKELMELSLKDQDGNIDIGIARIQADLAKYITSTQGKHDGYSTRTETDVTSNGETIVTREQLELAVNELLNKGDNNDAI